MLLHFHNGKVLGPWGFKSDLWVEDGKIAQGPQDGLNKCSALSYTEIDCRGSYVLPGLIDLQVNGVSSFDCARSWDDVEKVASILVQEGTTSFLPTCVSMCENEYQYLLDSPPSDSPGAHILGVHLEGPFLNPKYSGAHKREAISVARFSSFWEKLFEHGNIRLVTIAPEMAEAQKICALAEKFKISIAYGHCAYSEFFSNNAKAMVTHLFNAHEVFHHRSPGIIGEVLGRSICPYSLIVDGMHLHSDTVRLAYKSHPEGLVLVSDRVSETLGKSEYNSSFLHGGKSSLFQCVLNLMNSTGCSLAYAWECASKKPAEILGLENHIGRFIEGSDADIVIIDQSLTGIQACYLKGVKSLNSCCY